MAGRRAKRVKGKQVNVNLELEQYRLLQERAEDANLSATPFAKKLLIQALAAAAEDDRDGGKLDSIQDAIERLERELPGRLTAVILASLGGATRGGAAPSPARPMTLKEFIRLEEAEEPPEDETNED